jgi:hypothetical protein
MFHAGFALTNVFLSAQIAFNLAKSPNTFSKLTWSIVKATPPVNAVILVNVLFFESNDSSPKDSPGPTNASFCAAA